MGKFKPKCPWNTTCIKQWLLNSFQTKLHYFVYFLQGIFFRLYIAILCFLFVIIIIISLIRYTGSSVSILLFIRVKKYWESSHDLTSWKNCVCVFRNCRKILKPQLVSLFFSWLVLLWLITAVLQSIVVFQNYPF